MVWVVPIAILTGPVWRGLGRVPGRGPVAGRWRPAALPVPVPVP